MCYGRGDEDPSLPAPGSCSWLLYPCLSSPRWQPQGPQLCRVQHHGHTGASSFTTTYNLICFECKTKIQLLQDCSSPGDPELEAVDRALSPDTSEDTDSVHSGASGGGSRGQYINGTFAFVPEKRPYWLLESSY